MCKRKTLQFEEIDELIFFATRELGLLVLVKPEATPKQSKTEGVDKHGKSVSGGRYTPCPALRV